ncbi:hypothetical protein D018_0934B, partial [Vibrio parahaemolyticus VP2007-007]
VTVLNNNVVTRIRVLTCHNHGAITRRHYRRASWHSKVSTVMRCNTACYWV